MFVDAQQMAKEHPDTFSAPSQGELDAIKPLSIVKVCYDKERFWTTVLDVKGGKITGTVDNDLVLTEDFNYDDMITFEKRHVYAIWEDE